VPPGVADGQFDGVGVLAQGEQLGAAYDPRAERQRALLQHAFGLVLRCDQQYGKAARQPKSLMPNGPQSRTLQAGGDELFGDSAGVEQLEVRACTPKAR